MNVILGAVVFLGLWYLEAWGRTFGQRLMGIHTVHARTWRNPGPIAGLARLLAKVLTIATLGLGFVVVLSDPERRALHDRIAGTRVIEN